MNKDGGPAFPYPSDIGRGGTDEFVPAMTGMSLRQWYAGMAACGIYSNPNFGSVGRPVPNDGKVAEALFRFADAMIAEGEKE